MATRTFSVIISVEGDEPDSMAIAQALDMWNDNTPWEAPTLTWIGDEEVFD
jgi:hypothetical protein